MVSGLRMHRSLVVLWVFVTKLSTDLLLDKFSAIIKFKILSLYLKSNILLKSWNTRFIIMIKKLIPKIRNQKNINQSYAVIVKL